MWRPFRRAASERRESSFTDALVAQILGEAKGGAPATPTATGALQASAGMVARCFAGATVEGPPRLVEAVPPCVLSLIGRALIRQGEAVLVIDVGPSGDVRLVPAADWNVTGDYDPESWWYRVSLAGPSRYTTRANVPGAGVVHAKYEVDPARPWRGIGPLQSAALAGRLSAETAAALGEGESGPRGNLLPLPVDGEDSTVAALKSDLRNLGGKLAFVESVRTMHAGAAGAAPGGDWKPSGSGPPLRLPRSNCCRLHQRKSTPRVACPSRCSRQVRAPPSARAFGACFTPLSNRWPASSRRSCPTSSTRRSASTSTACSLPISREKPALFKVWSTAVWTWRRPPAWPV